LRSILRQDPDIILVGEIRDNETAEIAVRAALTGHLVLSTIHTNNSASTITRLKDMGIKPFLISSTVIGVISQRLVRKICPNCIEEYIAAQREMSILEVSETVKLKRGKGCSICNHTGYKGRTAIFEVMPVDVNVKEMIDAEKNEKEIETYAIKTGMINLRTACIKKVLDGITTVDELLRVTYGQ
jgi:type IV pilus assembly protein PilB